MAKGFCAEADGTRLADLCVAYAPTIRQQLTRFGVRQLELDDLIQEVFLFLHGKREELSEVRQMEPWLREICRRMAADHRRKTSRRHEIAFGEAPDIAADSQPPGAELEKGQEHERLHNALSLLDSESRDLLALREFGNLRLADVATLLDAGRKTVSKRLKTAIRRLAKLFGADQPSAPPLSMHAAGVILRSTAGRAGSAMSFEVPMEYPALRVGLAGTIVVAAWSGPATVDALGVLDLAFSRALEICQSGFAYLAIVEASTRPPNLKGRQEIVAILRAHANHIRAYATAVMGGGTSILVPIMSGLAALARPAFPMRFFNGLEPAVTWLTDEHQPHTRVELSAVLACAQQLRTL